MEESVVFLRLVLSSIKENIAVIDAKGNICFVNQSWAHYGDQNQCLIEDDWTQVNYLSICDQSALQGDDFGLQAARGIRQVIHKELESFSLEYPCHSDEKHQWFVMHVTPFEFQQKPYFVITHQDVTERKLAELAVEKLARLDGLTDIYNRRAFDELLEQEWQNCLVLKQPMSIAVIDLDHFKALNDHFGHLAGDECLKLVADNLRQYTQSPRRFCARYGGEEFALILSNCEQGVAHQICETFLQQLIREQDTSTTLKSIPNVTASIGLATLVPESGNTAMTLLNKADSLLYQAKSFGRNRIETELNLCDQNLA